eukprot:9175621-Ditylum_brightwellii.AAC.1
MIGQIVALNNLEILIALGTLVWIGCMMPPVALSATEGLGWEMHGRRAQWHYVIPMHLHNCCAALRKRVKPPCFAME